MGQWCFNRTERGNGGIWCYKVLHGRRPLTCGEFIDLLAASRAFRAIFIEELLRLPFSAYRWEMPPISKATTQRPAEFVIIDSPELNVAADFSAFRSTANAAAGESVAVFPNLSGDATLIVPVPTQSDEDFSHIAAFMRCAPEDFRRRLWAVVGRTFSGLLTENPLWLSTAGGGVAWLHVRIDQYPKYYRYSPYRPHSGNF